MGASHESTTAIYFERFLRPMIGRRMLPGLTSLSASFRIAFVDGAEDAWRIVVREGILETVEANDTGDCDCEYRIGRDDFSRVVAGKLNPKGAFFSGRVKIHGNLVTGLQVSTLMEEFFRRNPYPDGAP